MPGLWRAVPEHEHLFGRPIAVKLVFFAEGKLKRVGREGGVPQTLADAPDGGGGTWSPDNFIVFAPTGNGRLFRVPATGGQITRITELSAGQIGHRGPV